MTQEDFNKLKLLIYDSIPGTVIHGMSICESADGYTLLSVLVSYWIKDIDRKYGEILIPRQCTEWKDIANVVCNGIKRILN